MSVVLVPYHLDERLPDLALPVRPDKVVTAELPDAGEFWHRVTGLHAAVAEVVAADERPVLLTGDCTTALGVVAGLHRRGLDPAVIWFDAHGDLHTPQSSTSGYPGGMPLRMLIGDGDATVAAATGLRPVPAGRVILADGRDLDPPEVEYLATSQVRQAAVRDIPLPDGPIYLHIDLDVVDPAELPGLRYPVPDGPGPAAVGEAAGDILASGRVAALTIACTWYPGRREPADAAGPLITALLAAAAG